MVDVLLSVENSRRCSARCRSLSLVHSPRPGVREVKASLSASLSRLPILLHFLTTLPTARVMSEDAVSNEVAVAKQSTFRCVASTGDNYRCTVDEAHPGWADQVHGSATRADKNESNCFRHALLSADGTAVVTYNEDLILRTFAV
jgi:hypothetical protein